MLGYGQSSERSWGQSSASLQVNHSLGPGWILRGEKSSTGKAAAQRIFWSRWWQVFRLTIGVFSSCSSRSCAGWQLGAKCCAVGQAEEELCSESLRPCVGTGYSLRTKVNKLNFCNQRQWSCCEPMWGRMATAGAAHSHPLVTALVP